MEVVARDETMRTLFRSGKKGKPSEIETHKLKMLVRICLFEYFFDMCGCSKIQLIADVYTCVKAHPESHTTFTCIHTYTRTHTYTHTHTSIYMYVCVCVCVCVLFVCVCVCVCVCVHVCVYVCFLCLHMYVCVYMYICKYMCKHIYINI